MAVADVLKNIGSGVEKGLKVAGTVAQETLPDVLDPERGYENRQRQYQTEDAQIEVKAAELQKQLDAGRQYGTLNQQQQNEIVNQITGLYSHPRHAPKLMEKLRQIIHPKGAVAQAPMSESLGMPNAFPGTGEGGTAAVDAANKAASSNKSRPMNATNVALDKYTTDKFGVPFSDADSEQQLEAFGHVGKAKRQQRLVREKMPDPGSVTGWSDFAWDPESGEIVSHLPGAAPERGYIARHTVSHSTDQYGNTTETVRDTTPKPFNPEEGQGKGKSGSASPSATSKSPQKPVAQALAPSKAPIATKPAAVAPSPTSAPPATTLATALTPPAGKKMQLDADGHIPTTRGGNSQLIELANELLDGRDLKDIQPAKAKPLAAELARKYGWEQGKFTPKEQIALRESTTFLKDAANNPALKALDDDVFQKMIIGASMKDPDKEGLTGTLFSVAAGANLTPQQQEFRRMYQQLVGTIAGLTQLVRPGSRATEASINRLKQELPNILTSSSIDAKKRLERLEREITIAMQRGTFEGLGDETKTPAAAGGRKWSKAKWMAANPGGDVNAAAERHKAKGDQVVD
jgi:hypothetical protein